ncbi:MAG: flagellar basal-body MS-ring/collar protein FliF [Armatimonadota bacterium]|nr:flagellar basal-body MS-ring/collar protein FliF [Armatimonadota bacterium]
MLQQLRETWESLNRRQQIALAAMATVVVGALVAVGVWATRPTWAVLYSDLSPRDAQAVVEQLKEQGVPHRLVSGGGAVQVPQQRLYELRLQLAGEGLPDSSTVGFELFDRTSFSTSDLQNNVNLQRALQGELERSISTLDEISTARVHLALPKERLFTERQEPPSASVVVGLGGHRLSTEQVAAITQLVASAVPSLEPRAVTLVDTGGAVLSGGWDSGGGLLTMAQLEATRAYEERMRQHLQTMLDSVLGANHSVVRVQAELDFETQQLTRETLEPPAGEGMVTTEELTREQYEGEAGAEVGGPAGLTARGSRTASGEGGSYEHTHESREYDYSRTQEQLTRPPGRVRRLTVAVVIDESLDSAASAQVQQLVEAAAGVDTDRGDVVTVETMAIDAVKVAQEQQKAAEAAEAQRQRSRAIERATRYGTIILMLAMLAGAIVMFSRRLGPAEEPEDSQEPEDTPSQPEAVPAEAGEGAGQEELAFAPMTVDELQAATEGVQPDDRGLSDTLSALGSESPESFAELLRGWMSPESGSADVERDEK